MKKRIDQLLLDLNLARSRSQAQDLIKKGKVRVQGQVIEKASSKFEPEDEVTVEDHDNYVGRGAEKIAGAHKSFSLEFKDKVIGDIGACTGGFTDYALRNGALKSFAIDVGHGQLAGELLNDERVVNLEGINIKEPLELELKCDLIMIDLSHISQKLTLENCKNLMSVSGSLVSLFKPQFEVGKSKLGKNGIVGDTAFALSCLKEFVSFAKSMGLSLWGVEDCAIKGKKGNQEYFLHFRLEPCSEVNLLQAFIEGKK